VQEGVPGLAVTTPQPRPASNLPTALTSFVGRERELAEIQALLSQTRLLTLTGPGGCGKSRLALQAAIALTGVIRGGLWWVELAPITDPGMVAPVLAQTFRVRPLPGQTELEAVVSYLSTRRALVVLDNCEHVLDDAARAAEALARGCPALVLAATSREPLRAAGETEWRVPPLSLPAEGEPEPAAETSDAVRLFAERAAQVKPDFTLTPENGKAIATICRQLDGMPLAIELATARLRVLSVDQIADSLADRFGLLTGGLRTALPRHQALQASVDWSHELLLEQERMVFRRLGVFMAGFTLEAAKCVCAGDGVEPDDVLVLLAALVEKSLVQAEERGAVVRYRLLETMRQYALERLEDAGETEATLDHYRDFYLDMAELAAPGLLDAPQPELLARLDPESANLGQAISWAAATEPEKALRLSSALTFWWRLRSLFAQAEAGFTRALEAAVEPSTLRARTLWGRAFLLTFAGAMEPAVLAANQARDAAEAVGDETTLSRALWLIGVTMMWPDPIGSRPGLERARELASSSGDDLALMHATQALGMTYLFQDENRRARAFHDEALQLAERLNQRDALAWHWVAMANEAWIAGDHPALLAAADRAIDIAVEAGDVVTELVAASLHSLGYTECGQPQRALTRLAAVRERAVAEGGLLLLPAAQWATAVALAGDDRLEEARSALEALVEQGASGLAYILARTHVTLAETLRLLGETEGAARAVEGGLEIADHIAARTLAAEANLILGRLAAANGDWQVAQRLHHEALPIAVEYGSPRLPRVLEGLAATAFSLERHVEAARILGAAARLWGEMGAIPWPHQRREERAVEAEVRDALGDEYFLRALAEGRELGADDVVAYVRRTRGSRKRPASGWESLTPTERQVATLVGEGASNKEIAAKLFMSVATVKSHLTHVYAKLDLKSRAGLAGEVMRRKDTCEA
jgi:predicted ATPase/DNA-binding CsgD family transcriptional regulator